MHDLYTIAGRIDAGTCTASVIASPTSPPPSRTNNVIFRIPTPVFGAGLIENIEETDLLANQARRWAIRSASPARSTATATTARSARFGWKAQNKSLEIFAGEAYNVEMGVSNELFTQERPLPEEDRAPGLPPPCKINPTPEDHTNFNRPRSRR